MADNDADWTAAPGRHASNLELFVDLVFVFCVTQVSSLMSHQATALGLGRGLVVSWLVWWLWSQFTWLGTAIDLERELAPQVLVICAVPMALLMSVAIPESFADSGPQFAGAYFAVQLWALAIQGRGLWGDAMARAAWLRYVPMAALSPTVVLVGGFLSPSGRLVMWSIGGALNVLAAVLADTRKRSGTAEWNINPTHFAERHALFVIIALGEALVAIGATASESATSARAGLGIVAAATTVCIMWWIYFAYIPRVTEQALERATGGDRGQVARDLFTFGHFPIVLGVILFAVAARSIVAAPGKRLDGFQLWTFGLGLALFIGALAIARWVAAHSLATERISALVAVVALTAAAGTHLTSTQLVICAAVILSVMQVVTLRNRATAARSNATGGH